MSRRDVLGWATFAALSLPFACKGEKVQAKGRLIAPVPQTPNPTPSANSPIPGPPKCEPVLLPFGTEVPFDDKDRAFLADADQFERKRKPKPGDWMARFSETGLSFDEYVASRPTSKRGERNVLVLQPLGSFRPSERKQLNEIVEFTATFFDTKVRVAPALQLPQSGQRLREDSGKRWIQHHTRTVLNWLADGRVPPDAVCVLGVTMDDLYPEPSWNYVFGEATLEKRVGVYSLARYGAKFWGEQDDASSLRRQVLRSFKVLAHETGHMFSLRHCRRYECLMNGANSLEELDRSPIEPCPICLKMLQYNLRFDIRSRYRRLQALYEHGGLNAERDWVRLRLERIGCSSA